MIINLIVHQKQILSVCKLLWQKISRIYHGIVTTFDREADSFLPSLNQAANKTQLIVSNGQNLQLDELNFYGLVLFITQFNRTTHRPIKWSSQTDRPMALNSCVFEHAQESKLNVNLHPDTKLLQPNFEFLEWFDLSNIPFLRYRVHEGYF